jgi:hypothetical protein
MRIYIISPAKRIGSKWSSLLPDYLKMENCLPIEVEVVSSIHEDYRSVVPVNKSYLLGGISYWNVAVEELATEVEMEKTKEFEGLFEI